MLVNYMQESQGYDYWEEPGVGFMLYRVYDVELHLGHIYVSPEHRKKGNLVRFFDKCCEIAREKGCTVISGLVIKEGKTPEQFSRLVRSYLQYGTVIHSIPNDNQIIFRKDL